MTDEEFLTSNIEVGDFVVPTYDFWLSLISQRYDDLVTDSFDVWPSECKIISIHVFGSLPVEICVSFKGFTFWMWTTNIDEVIKK